MATTRGSRGPYHCSFCGKSQDQVRRLIAGPGSVYICDECVELCREIIDEIFVGKESLISIAKADEVTREPAVVREPVAAR